MNNIDTSFYIIKPEALMYCDEIHSIITSSNLIIYKSAKVILPESFIEKLYLKSKKEVLEITIRHLCESKCEIGIVKGHNVIKRLFNLCGEDLDPQKCSEGSIRKLYGLKEPIVYKGVIYYKNAIHRPKTEKEVKQFINNVELLIDESP